jgi:signal transduction histidine kinase
MARVFNKLGKTDSAMYYARNALALGQKSSLAYTIVEAAGLLTDIFKSRRQIDSAFKYQEMLLAAKDSIFNQEKVKEMQNLSFNEQIRQQDLKSATIKHKNWIRLYILLTALAIVIMIGIFLWRSNINKQRAYNLLEKQKQETDVEKTKVEKAYAELESTQAQLIQKEKMASLGELTAGIAHEIQNPLNFINNFSEVNTELIDEMEASLQNKQTEEAIMISREMKQNLQKITQHGKRADAIVKGMLLHAKKNTGIKEPTNINALVDEYLRLSYHGIRAKDKSFHANYKTQFDESIGKIDIIPQDIGRVLLNLFNNAFYSVNLKKKQINNEYEPYVLVSTFKRKNKVEIHVKDNGVGIQKAMVDKIYQPFFSTKPSGHGTGLGLSISYDIIKVHGGQLKVNSKEGEGAEFIIALPVTPL